MSCVIKLNVSYVVKISLISFLYYLHMLQYVLLSTQQPFSPVVQACAKAGCVTSTNFARKNNNNMICITCCSYFKRTLWNNSLECDKCVDKNDKLVYNTYIEEDDKVDIDTLVNPTGKTQGVFYD